VEDIALVMNTIALPDARDWTSLPFDAVDYLVGLKDGVKGLRVAYSPTLGYAKNVDPEIAAATAQAAKHLQDLGAVVEQVDPLSEDPLDITTGLWFAGAYQVWQSLSPAQQALTDPDFKAQAELGEKLDANALHQLTQRRGVLGSHLRQFMQRFDLILTPSTAVAAFKALPAGHSPMNSAAMLGWTPFSYPFNLSQQPAISLPCGLTTQGLPIGVQLVGPMFGDAVLLRAAHALQSCYPVIRPPLAGV
jgi:aspartyl-tRNA(Asn)/glutamyl-tRNA(Gln) amidotransferase subunit A